MTDQTDADKPKELISPLLFFFFQDEEEESDEFYSLTTETNKRKLKQQLLKLTHRLASFKFTFQLSFSLSLLNVK